MGSWLARLEVVLALWAVLEIGCLGPESGLEYGSAGVPGRERRYITEDANRKNERE